MNTRQSSPSPISATGSPRTQPDGSERHSRTLYETASAEHRAIVDKFMARVDAAVARDVLQRIEDAAVWGDAEDVSVLRLRLACIGTAARKAVAGSATSGGRDVIARNLLDAKYLNPECAEHGCQWLKAVESATSDPARVQSDEPAQGERLRDSNSSSLVLSSSSLRTLVEAIRVFRTTAGRHAGPHDTDAHGCKECELSYVVAEAELDRAQEAVAALLSPVAGQYRSGSNDVGPTTICPACVVQDARLQLCGVHRSPVEGRTNEDAFARTGEASTATDGVATASTNEKD